MSEQIKSFDALLSTIKDNKRKPVRTAVVGISDGDSLAAIVRAKKEGLISPLILGSKDKIEQYCIEAGIESSSISVLNCENKDDEAAMAAGLAGDRQVELLFCANIENSKFLGRLFDKSVGFRNGKRLISHVAVFEHEKYPRLLLMSDGVINVAPDINKKLKIIQNAVGLANMFGVAKPKVAMLAAVEVIYPGMPVTVEGAVISKMVDKGQIKNCLIDGPLSWDVATMPDVAREKGATSEVAGQADIVIAPNIETGNAIYKAMSMFVKARTAGLIVGGKIPLAVSSRCDNSDNIFYSLLLGSDAVMSKT
ncbi:MAG: phosphate butyryltransferase [FCB group bacterium]|nr:phosphate butyryltransferase [FCB group bacterium]